MEGLNIQQCKHWYLEGGGAPSKDEEFCAPAPNVHQYCERIFTQDRSGKVISAVCKVRLNSKGTFVDLYQCEKADGHPMSNAIYKLISKETEFKTYECVQGCTDDVAKVVYDQGYESTVPNSKYERDIAAFQKRCKSQKP
jgi:hypothetical protein